MRSVDPSLLTKLGSQEQTISNSADPKMFVAVARARNTVVDSTYWTVETIREGVSLGDVSVAARRFKVTGPPNRIYEIHVEGGVVGTSIREYPDKLKDGFIDQFSLGNGSAVAIAFDGRWERYRNSWRLITEEEPWIMWVDSANVLWAQLWNDATTRLQLAEGVASVRAIRGWKNVSTPELDQGIVVGFIKTDGSVWYRNYCQQADYSYAWEYEKEVVEFTGTTADSLNLFITNDYRIGFAIEDNLGQIHWLITDRNWAGMASPDEYLTAGLKDITFEVTPITYYDVSDDENITAGISNIWFNVAEPIYPELIAASNDDEVTIRLLFTHEIDYDLTGVSPAFTIKDALNIEFEIISTSAGLDNSEIVFNMENFNGAFGDITITYDRSVIELDCLNQGSRFAIESFEEVFTPELIPPEGFATENLTAGITDLTFDVLRVDYLDAFNGGEYLTVDLDITFVVTKVGDNPL